jgi:hypothetical protein
MRDVVFVWKRELRARDISFMSTLILFTSPYGDWGKE